MLKLSKLTDYAVVVLARLGRQDVITTSASLSQATGVPEPTVAKILKILAANDLVDSHRGARGGYSLARSLADISIACVITAMDGPISLTACVDGRDCEASAKCGLCGNWDPVNEAIRRTLGTISLEDMMAGGGAPSSRLQAGTKQGLTQTDHRQTATVAASLSQ